MARRPEERVQSAALVEASLLSLDQASAPQTRVSLKPVDPAGKTFTIDATTLAPRHHSHPGPRALRLRRLAVLPLANLGSEDDAYLADGLTDDLIDALSSLKLLETLGQRG